MGQALLENFDFLVKVKVPTWSKHFFFFQAILIGSGERFILGRPGKIGQIVVGSDIIHDVIALEDVSMCGACTGVRVAGTCEHIG